MTLEPIEKVLGVTNAFHSIMNALEKLSPAMRKRVLCAAWVLFILEEPETNDD